MAFNKISFDYTNQLANKVEEIYSENQIDIPSNSELSEVIRNIRFITSGHHLLSSSNFVLPPSFSYNTAIKNAACFSFLAEGIINAYESCSDREVLKKHLRNIAKYPFLPYSPVNQSNQFGKGSAYELFFIKLVMDAGYKVDIFGEPDNIIYLSSQRKIGIHCKHPYSWDRLVRNFNRAVRQVSQSRPDLLKIVTISLDELFKHYLFWRITFLDRPNIKQVVRRIDNFLIDGKSRLENKAKEAHRKYPNLIALAVTLTTVVFADRWGLISTVRRALILSLIDFTNPIFSDVNKFKNAIEKLG